MRRLIFYKAFCHFAMAVLTIFIMGKHVPGREVYGAGREEEILPPLVQTTTLEGDYKALTRLGLAVTPLLMEENPAWAFDNILCSCVRIQVNGYYGSGSIYQMLEDEIIIVTNRHVLQYWEEEGYVTFFNGAVSPAVLLGTSKVADVGFISVPTGGFTYEELLTFRNIRLPFLADKEGMTENTVEGQKIFLVNMAENPGQPLREEGEIVSPLVYMEDFQMEMLYGKGNAIPGMSGSGVFDGCGQYLGMLTGGNLTGEIAAVPVSVIKKEYEKCMLVQKTSPYTMGW